MVLFLHLYHSLIHLQDADTLDQTVVQMQEENHVPSPQLADLIHRKRHGIPGNNTPASPENEQEASEKTTGKKRQRSKKTKPATPVDTTSETTPTTVDSAAASAPMAAAMGQAMFPLLFNWPETILAQPTRKRTT